MLGLRFSSLYVIHHDLSAKFDKTVNIALDNSTAETDWSNQSLTLQLHTTSSSEPRTDKDMQCIKENLVLVTQVTVHDNLVDNELEC